VRRWRPRALGAVADDLPEPSGRAASAHCGGPTVVGGDGCRPRGHTAKGLIAALALPAVSADSVAAIGEPPFMASGAPRPAGTGPGCATARPSKSASSSPASASATRTSSRSSFATYITLSPGPNTQPNRSTRAGSKADVARD
jgi:hypothetical protein